MRSLLISVAITTATLSVNAWSQTPTAGFISPGPGLNAPFAVATSVDTYGKEELVAGWAFIGGSGTPVSLSPIARYSTSLEDDNGTVTPMSPLEDWVFSFTYGLRDNLFANDQVLISKTNNNTANERKVIDLLRIGNEVTLRAGNSSDGWTPVADPIDMTPPEDGETFVDFAIHYKSATNTMDAYANDVLIADDFTLGHGDYAIEFIQLQPAGPEIDDLQKDEFRLLKIGQLVPPPPDNADFDGNGRVDGNDFLIWQRNFGTAGAMSSGDANADFLINGKDLDAWSSQFGMGSNLAAVNLVPEPCSCVLIAFAVMACSFSRVPSRTTGEQLRRRYLVMVVAINLLVFDIS